MTTPIERSRIPGNRWDLLVPEDDHRWVPSERVSICIPVRDPDRRFQRTLLALSRQTYPEHLVEVVVVDDSSREPVVIEPSDSPYPTRVIRQDSSGFAAGRARHTAATHASGDVFFFLDCDVIPGPRVIESYLRWFTRSREVVPFGFCRFVELDGLSDERLLAALEREDDLGAGLVEVDGQEWREATFARTADMTIETPDMFRTIVGATLAIGSSLYARAGGFRDVGVRGIEDIEFGYRLQNHGAILVPDRDAIHWHQGRRSMSGHRLHEIADQRRPYAERLLPVGGFRTGTPARAPVEIVPQLEIRIDEDLWTSDWAQRLAESVGHDTAVVPQSEAPDRSAFALLDLHQAVEWTDAVTSDVVAELISSGSGTVLIAHPDVPSGIEVIRNRTASIVGDVDQLTRLRLGGVSVVAWDDLGGRSGVVDRSKIDRAIAGGLRRLSMARRPGRTQTLGNRLSAFRTRVQRTWKTKK